MSSVSGWFPDDLQLLAITKCKEVLKSDEEFIKGWVLVSINQWDNEQERVVLLTNKALYRVKYDFPSETVERFERTALKDIRLVQKGPFKYGRFSFSGLLSGKKVKQQYGIRIFVGDNKPGNPFSESQNFRTYAANANGFTGPVDGAAEQCITDFLNCMETARKGITSRDDGFLVLETQLERSNYLGPISHISNALHLGMYDKSSVAKGQSNSPSKEADGQ